MLNYQRVIPKPGTSLPPDPLLFVHPEFENHSVVHSVAEEDVRPSIPPPGC